MPPRGSQKTQWLQMRSCKRTDSRIRVLIEWSEEGHTGSAEGLTTDIGRLGCLVVVQQGLPLKLRVRLTNLETRQWTDATVAWKDHEPTVGWELGLELLNAPQNFWGQEI